MQQVVVLGSTGSIGKSTLDVVARHPDRYRVLALTCQRNIEILIEQARQFRPRYVVVVDAHAERRARDILAQESPSVTVLGGEAALGEVASHPDADVVMAAIVGAAGLLPTMAAVEAGKRLLLANKESLVMAGSLFMQAVADSGSTLMPIDSEHNAIFQCMPAGYADGLERCGVERILLTASGGPFRCSSAATLAAVTPEQACAHPNWSMGRKISVDSATLMNKGLELIEACYLFDTTAESVEVVVHPQSIIHSMVQYIDGSVLAQLGNPDMRTPIAHGLAWPERIHAGVAPLDVFMAARLDFEAPDTARFPCLRLAQEVCTSGGTAGAVLNAANEIAVESFLQGQLGFLEIPSLIESVLAQSKFFEPTDIAGVKAADGEARQLARQQLMAMSA